MKSLRSMAVVTMLLMSFASTVQAVSSSDCKAEQAKLFALETETYRSMSGVSASYAEYARIETEKAKKTLDDFVAQEVAKLMKTDVSASAIQSYIDYHEKTVIPGRENDVRNATHSAISKKAFLARGLLELCLWKTRVRELGSASASSATGASSRGVSSPPRQGCESSKVEAVNQKLASTDEKVAEFMQSNAGLQSGRATEHMQVIMWATQEQQNILQSGGCMEDEDFAAKARSFPATFKKAQEACMAMQSNPSVCVPKLPGQVIADYDRPRAAAPDESTSPSPLKKDQPGEDCTKQGSRAGQVACIASMCRNQGVEAYVQNECVFCGGESTMSDGYRWNQGPGCSVSAGR